MNLPIIEGTILKVVIETKRDETHPHRFTIQLGFTSIEDRDSIFNIVIESIQDFLGPRKEEAERYAGPIMRRHKRNLTTSETSPYEGTAE